MPEVFQQERKTTLEMDVPESTSLWPSASGPKVPKVDGKLRKTDKLDMDGALACLRRELAAMQTQDRNLHKQLLAMRCSISGLKDELKNERENWEMETLQEDREQIKPAPAPGYVTKVEVINSSPEGPRINHAKQDSGILTDEERSDEELEESVQQMLKTYPPMTPQRSSSFSVSVNRSHGSIVVKRDETGDEEAKRKPARNPIRVRARSVATIEIGQLSTAAVSPRNRSQTFAEGTFNRFGSMPVINEIPGDALERNTSRSKTFALYGSRPTQSAVVRNNKSSFSLPRKLPIAFGTLTRHGSMPVMYHGGRPKSASGSGNTNENAVKLVSTNQPIKRSTSQLVLSRPAWEKAREFESNQMMQHRVYRSSSQVSLV